MIDRIRTPTDIVVVAKFDGVFASIFETSGTVTSVLEVYGNDSLPLGCPSPKLA